MPWPSWNVESTDRRRVTCACTGRPWPLPTTLVLVHPSPRHLGTTIPLAPVHRVYWDFSVLAESKNLDGDELLPLSVGTDHGDGEITGHNAGAPQRLTCTVHTQLAKLRIQKRPRDRTAWRQVPVTSIVSDGRPKSNRCPILIFEESLATKSSRGPTQKHHHRAPLPATAPLHRTRIRKIV
jgi:hypothetical protein